MNHCFLTIDEVLAIHSGLIDLYGGPPGLRDAGGLESAVMRPQMGYYDGLVEEAAALMESLAMNHPFVDGNKRVAFGATEVFLRMNGHFIDCDSRAAYAYFMRLFDNNTFRFNDIEGLAGGTPQASLKFRAAPGTSPKTMSNSGARLREHRFPEEPLNKSFPPMTAERGMYSGNSGTFAASLAPSPLMGEGWDGGDGKPGLKEITPTLTLPRQGGGDYSDLT